MLVRRHGVTTNVVHFSYGSFHVPKWPFVTGARARESPDPRKYTADRWGIHTRMPFLLTQWCLLVDVSAMWLCSLGINCCIEIGASQLNTMAGQV